MRLQDQVRGRLDAEDVRWWESVKAVDALKKTCAPTSVISAYLIARLAEALEEQMQEPRPSGYELSVGSMREGEDLLVLARKFLDR